MPIQELEIGTGTSAFAMAAMCASDSKWCLEATNFISIKSYLDAKLGKGDLECDPDQTVAGDNRNMRSLIAALFATIGSSIAQEGSPSKQLEQRFLAIVTDEVTSMMREVTGQPPTAEEVSRVMKSAIREIQASYGSLLILPEAEANKLLTIGPDNEANVVAMQRDVDLWKKVQRPMPTLLKRMQVSPTTTR